MELPDAHRPTAQGADLAQKEHSIRSTVSTDLTLSTKDSSITIDSGIDIDSKEKAERPCADALTDRPSTWIRRSGQFLRIVVFTVYRQLLTIVCISNAIAIVAVVVRTSDSAKSPLGDMATAATANLTAAVLIRQDYVRNLLFHICWSVPHSAPLWLRRRLAKIYENGGIHSGAAVCAVGWHITFVSTLTSGFLQHPNQKIPLLSLSYGLLAILAAIVCLALPQVRSRHHNLFENTHRLGGWLCILLF